MNWKDLYTWEKGAWIGFFIWLGLLIIAFFRYFYSRFFVESLGSEIQPFLFFSFPNLFMLSIYGILIIIIGGLIGYFIDKKWKF